MKGLRLGGGALGSVCAIALATGASAAAAKVWHVNSTADPGSGCPAGGQCTLRGAIGVAANGDTIDVPAGHYALTPAVGALTVAKSIKIVGGPGLVKIDGGRKTGVFVISSGASVQLKGVTVTDGNASNGGDISNQGSLILSNSTVTNGAASRGGDIYSSGSAPGASIRIIDSTISAGNASVGGGGIYDDSGTTAVITDSTIRDNTVVNESAIGGGGIYDQGNSLTITNSTIIGNFAPLGGTGGGLYDNDNFNVAIANATIKGNSSPGAANAYFQLPAPIRPPPARRLSVPVGPPQGLNVGFVNTIVSAPLGGGTNCGSSSGIFVGTNGHNLESDAAGSCGFSTATHDQLGVNPKLGPLAANGGPTKTVALLTGSPAIDAGTPVKGVTSTDQRGFPRPVGTGPDIGAYEYGALVDVALAGSANGPVKVGDELIYRLTVSNHGPTTDAAVPARISDILPADVQYVSSSKLCSREVGSRKVLCSIASVPSGQSATVQIVVRPQNVGNPVDTASASSTGVDPHPANNGQTLRVSVRDVPAVSTDGADPVLYRGATLHGSVNPRNAMTTYYFEYGRTTSYGSQTGGMKATGLTSLSVLAKLTGLAPGEVYHYRVVAQNAEGIVRGRDRTFLTPYLPVVHVDPSRVKPGERIHVYGSVGECPAASPVTVISKAFSDAHTYQGEGAIYTTVQPGGKFSIRTQIPGSRKAGPYKISALCGHFP